MPLKTQKKGQIGINAVEGIVLKELRGRWQPIEAHNDDGMDGLIFLEDKHGEATGQIVFAQIKCWSIKFNKDNIVKLNIARSDIEERAARWSRVAGAAILIWVDPNDNYNAYWSDLRDINNFCGEYLLIYKWRKFCSKSLNRLRRLCGTITLDGTLPLIETSKADISYISPAKAVKASAKILYKSIGKVTARNQNLGDVTFGRFGWKHITRKERPVPRVMQSLQLLNVAKRIIAEVPNMKIVRTLTNYSSPAEIIALTARVTFPHRDAAVIRVILLRQLPGSRVSEPKTWFYSVYERRRKLGLRGEHKK